MIENPLCATKRILREPAFFQQAPPKHMLDTKQRNIVFIEPMGGLFPMIRRGKGNGYNIIILTQNEREAALPRRILRISDWNVQVNTTMTSCVLDRVLEMAKFIEIDAVIPGMDFYVNAASTSARYIGKPAISYEVAQKVRFKDLMRQALKDKGVRIPKFRLLTQETTDETIDQFIDKAGFPLVVKPVDCSGSVNVERVKHKTGIHKALNKIINSNRLWGVTLDADRALIEEYIPGKEYSVEGIVQKESATVISITEKFVSDQVHFIEIGHISNPPMDSRQRTTITEYTKEVIKAIGINNAPFHAELRFNGEGEPVLMEIAARLCGDKIAELIRHTTGVNFYDLVYKVYLGEEINYQRLIKGVYSGVVSFDRKNIDVIRSIENVDRILANPNVKELMLYYSEGEEIHNWHWAVESVRVGHAILNNIDYESLKIELRSTDEQLIVK